MNDSTPNLIEIIAAIIAFVAIFGWFKGKSVKFRENKFNKELRQQLDKEKADLEKKIKGQLLEQDKRESYLASLRQQFELGFLQGRKWLHYCPAKGLSTSCN